MKGQRLRPNRHLTFGGYLMALYLGTVPLTETLLAVWPLQSGDAAWRYGAVGLFSRALMTPLLGLLLAVCLALYVRHRVLLLAFAVVSGLGALLTIGRLRHQVWYRGRISVPLSLLIAAVGLYWSAQRIFVS